MAKSDIQRLTGAANQIADGLKRLKLPGLRIKTKITADPEENGNGGWSADIASWRGRPTIAVSLDKFAYAPKRVFWVGFWSQESEPIRKLYESLSEAPEALNDDNAEERDGIWVLKRSLAQSLLNRPIAEHYDEENDFGYYDSSHNVDIAHAVDFIAGVVVGQENGADEESVDIKLIDQNPDLDETQKTQLIQARRGQGMFRKQLERLRQAVIR